MSNFFPPQHPDVAFERSADFNPGRVWDNPPDYPTSVLGGPPDSVEGAGLVI